MRSGGCASTLVTGVAGVAVSMMDGLGLSLFGRGDVGGEVAVVISCCWNWQSQLRRREFGNARSRFGEEVCGKKISPKRGVVLDI